MKHPRILTPAILSIALAAACSDANSERGVSFEEFGVCIASQTSELDLQWSQPADFYLVEMHRGYSRVARVYVGYNPDVDSSLLHDIRDRRDRYSVVSPLDLDGGDALGVPRDRRTAYFHVMFSSADDPATRREILDSISFCPERQAGDELTTP